MSRDIIALRINREGKFIVDPDAETDGQCGFTGARMYRYFVSIEADNSKLTPEGFVMENQWVDDYFQYTYMRKGVKAPSCEEMAQAAIHHFRNVFATHKDLEGVNLRRILVRIHGSDVSFIEGEWKV